MGCLNCNDDVLVTTGVGNSGTDGAPGAAGATGVNSANCVEFDGTSTIGGVPLANELRVDNIAANLISEIYVSHTNQDGDDIEDWLISFSNSGDFGVVSIYNTTADVWWIGTVTGVTNTVAGPAGYHTIAVTWTEDNGFGSGDANDMVLCFVPAGADGADGSDGAAGESGGYCTSWIYSSNTIAPPPIGGIEFNAGVPPFNAITAAVIYHSNANGDDVEQLLLSFDNSGQFGRLVMYEKSDPTQAWFGEVTAVSNFGPSNYVQVLLTYIDDTGFAPTNGDEVVVCFVPASAADGYVWDDYGTTCAAITGFDAAADTAKIDILIDWLCSRSADIDTIQTQLATAPVVFDSEYDCGCNETITISLVSLYSGVFPANTFTTEDTNTATNGTIAHVGGAGPAPGSGVIRYTATGCNTTDDFSFRATDTEATTVASDGTVTINISSGGLIPSAPVVFARFTITAVSAGSVDSFDLDFRYGDILGSSVSITDAYSCTVTFEASSGGIGTESQIPPATWNPFVGPLVGPVRGGPVAVAAYVTGADDMLMTFIVSTFGSTIAPLGSFANPVQFTIAQADIVTGTFQVDVGLEEVS